MAEPLTAAELDTIRTDAEGTRIGASCTDTLRLLATVDELQGRLDGRARDLGRLTQDCCDSHKRLEAELVALQRAHTQLGDILREEQRLRRVALGRLERALAAYTDGDWDALETELGMGPFDPGPDAREMAVGDLAQEKPA